MPNILLFTQISQNRAVKAYRKGLWRKMSCCLVSEFNRAQESEGRSTAEAYAIWQWLNQHRPKVALHPRKVDYCDSCKRMELSRLRQVIKRLRQSGNASADNIQSNEQAVTEIEQALKGPQNSCSWSTNFLSRNYSEVFQKVDRHRCFDGKDFTQHWRRGGASI